MFEFVRSHTRLFQGILVILVFPSFVFFGVQGYSRFTDGSSAEVATVDGRPITRGEWDQAHQQASERVRRQAPSVDPKLLDSAEFRSESLNNLVRERTLVSVAQKHHLLPSEERAAQIFRTDPQLAPLRTSDGTVNKDILAAQGLTSEGFLRQLRLDLAMRQVMSPAETAATMPKASLKATLDAWLNKREVQWERFDSAALASRIKPSDEDLQRHLKENEKEFRISERADIDYVVLDLEGVEKSLSVSAEELKRYYDENISRFTDAEERRASHILIRAEKDMPAAQRQEAQRKAQELLERLRRAPTTFSEVARKESQDPGSAAKGGDLDFFSRGAMVKPFEEAVFAMKVGEISPVVESDFGFHIIQLNAVRGGSQKSFESVRSTIEATIKRQMAQKRFAELAEIFTNTVYEQSESLQPVMDRLKLQKNSASVERKPAPTASGPLASVKLLDALFSAESLKGQRNTDAIDLGNSQLVSARVIKYHPERTPSLEEVKDKVRAAVVKSQAAALARREGQDRLAVLKDPKVAMIGKTELIDRSAVTRVPRQVVDAVLQAPTDALPTTLGVDLGPEGYAVVRVLKTLEREVVAGQEAALAPQLASVWSAAESALYYEALKKQLKVSVKGAAASPATGPASGAKSSK